jgi:hypothetical protein
LLYFGGLDSPTVTKLSVSLFFVRRFRELALLFLPDSAASVASLLVSRVVHQTICSESEV